jgi:hypothetical protein
MKTRTLLLCLTVGLLLAVPSVSQATALESAPAESAAEQTLAIDREFARGVDAVPAASTIGASAIGASAIGASTIGATTSRRRSPLMTNARARAEAMSSARQIYLSPEFAFDAYGVGDCFRMGRSQVRCYTWVSEDFYDSFGYYEDTMLCDWWTTSRYNWTGRLLVTMQQTDCVWLSEV